MPYQPVVPVDGRFDLPAAGPGTGDGLVRAATSCRWHTGPGWRVARQPHRDEAAVVVLIAFCRAGRIARMRCISIRRPATAADGKPVYSTEVLRCGLMGRDRGAVAHAA